MSDPIQDNTEVTEERRRPTHRVPLPFIVYLQLVLWYTRAALQKICFQFNRMHSMATLKKQVARVGGSSTFLELSLDAPSQDDLWYSQQRE